MCVARSLLVCRLPSSAYTDGCGHAVGLLLATLTRPWAEDTLLAVAATDRDKLVRLRSAAAVREL